MLLCFLLGALCGVNVSGTELGTTEYHLRQVLQECQRAGGLRGITLSSSTGKWTVLPAELTHYTVTCGDQSEHHKMMIWVPPRDQRYLPLK